MFRFTILAALTLALPQTATAKNGADSYYDFLDREVIGASAFTKAHPSWDGRGVVIAVLDTGVDPGVEGLLRSSTGKTKVIETRDFSGEGDVALLRTRRSAEDGVDLLRTEDGVVRGVDALSG